MTLTIARADIVHISSTTDPFVELRVTIKDGELTDIFLAKILEYDGECTWRMFHFADMEQLRRVRAAIDEVLQELDKERIA